MATDNAKEKLIEYLIKSFEEVALINGQIRYVSMYGGSAYVVFENEKRYRLNFGLYISEVIDENFV